MPNFAAYSQTYILISFMKKLLCMLLAIFPALIPLAAKNYVVTSPDKAYKLTVTTGEGPTTYTLDYKGKTVINKSAIGLRVADGRVIGNGAVSSSKKSTHKGVVKVPVGKTDSLTDNYNPTRARLRQGRLQPDHACI